MAVKRLPPDARPMTTRDRPAAAGGAPRAFLAAWLVAAMLLLAFTAFTLAYEPGGNAALDRESHRFSAWLLHGGEIQQFPFDTLAWFAGPGFSSVFAAAMMLWLAVRRRILAAAMVGCALVAMTGVELLLRVRVEALPWSDIPDLLLHPRGRNLMDSSYPSGHVARWFLIAGIVVALLPRRWQVRGLVIAIILGLAIAIQRIWGTSHTGSDAVGGFLLGGGAAAVYAGLLPAAARWEQRLLALITGGAVPPASHPGT